MDFKIITDRLIIRPPVESDDNKLFDLMSDSRLTKFLSWTSHENIETTRKLIQNLIYSQQNDNGYHWCICLENNIIGIVSLIDVRRTIRTWTLNRSELSYWIDPEFQGKGFATEASRAVVNFGFEKLNFHKIIVAHAKQNLESKSICDKLGFILYANEHDAFYKDGEWYDLFWYELIKNKI